MQVLQVPRILDELQAWDDLEFPAGQIGQDRKWTGENGSGSS